MLQGLTITTRNSDINNKYDAGFNKTHDYCNELEVFGIADDKETEEIRSTIDRIYWEIVSEIMKDSNLMVGYCGSFFLDNFHVQTKKCNNCGYYTLSRMKLFMKIIKKDTRKENFCI